jgi:hypothetical protein
MVVVNYPLRSGGATDFLRVALRARLSVFLPFSGPVFWLSKSPFLDKLIDLNLSLEASGGLVESAEVNEK